jgi:hypothetical protein
MRPHVPATLLLAVVVVLGCGNVSRGEPDAAGGCEPESDEAFCSRIGKTCEAHSAPDNCNVSRTVDCGTCAGGQGCVVGVCQTPVCQGYNYTVANAGATFSRPGIEDGVNAATPDGRVIVFHQTPSDSGASCRAFQILVADETAPGAYVARDANPVLAERGLFIGQNAFAITADGLTLVAQTADRKRWVTTTRSALHVLDFGAPSDADFVAINATLTEERSFFLAPVLSSDGLELVYTIYDVTSQVAYSTYASVRASTSEPFPAGTRIEMPQPDPENYTYATGISSDRLTLFVFYGFAGRILTRSSTSGTFVNPNSPAPPPQIPAWEHKPLADCSVLVAMNSPGGCQNEDVVFLTRQ